MGVKQSRPTTTQDLLPSEHVFLGAMRRLGYGVRHRRAKKIIQTWLEEEELEEQIAETERMMAREEVFADGRSVLDAELGDQSGNLPRA
jgi:hypothetical protein